MPVTGRKPKGGGQSRNRARPAYDWIEVLDAPFRNAPNLPRKMPNGLPWPAAARTWWKAVSRMPHCTLWADSDWQFALDTAYIAGLFQMQGDKGYAAELRNREKVLGTTADFRRDLRIRYVSPDGSTTSPADADAGVTRLDDYRDL